MGQRLTIGCVLIAGASLANCGGKATDDDPTGSESGGSSASGSGGHAGAVGVKPSGGQAGYVGGMGPQAASSAQRGPQAASAERVVLVGTCCPGVGGEDGWGGESNAGGSAGAVRQVRLESVERRAAAAYPESRTTAEGALPVKRDGQTDTERISADSRQLPARRRRGQGAGFASPSCSRTKEGRRERGL